MGAVTDQEARNMTGYPGIGQLPVLSAIISSNTRQRDHNQILVVITPHLIRKPFHETGASTIWGLGR
jgi:Flp pilus assembly secretin CpaC